MHHYYFFGYLLETFHLLQVSLLLQISVSHVNFASHIDGIHRNQSEIVGEIFNWLSILWERGFCHDNPQGTACLLKILKVLMTHHYKQVLFSLFIGVLNIL